MREIVGNLIEEKDLIGNVYSLLNNFGCEYGIIEIKRRRMR